jgi:hypothetical protein
MLCNLLILQRGEFLHVAIFSRHLKTLPAENSGRCLLALLDYQMDKVELRAFLSNSASTSTIDVLRETNSHTLHYGMNLAYEFRLKKCKSKIPPMPTGYRPLAKPYHLSAISPVTLGVLRTFPWHAEQADSNGKATIMAWNTESLSEKSPMPQPGSGTADRHGRVAVVCA